MNFEDLQKAWQSQNAGAKVTIDAEVLLKEVRRNQQQFWARIFWRDVREVGAAFLMALYFSYHGQRHHHWTNYLLAGTCFGVGAFMVIDRLLQWRKQPAQNDSIKACVQSSWHQVSHQIWLLKNVFWWYLLPPAVALEISFCVSAWHSRNHLMVAVFSFVAPTVIVTLLYWGIYLLNQLAVRKSLEPRRQELETLLTTLDENKTIKNEILSGIRLVSALTVGVVDVSAASTASNDMTQAIEGIRKKHDLPALAVVVVKDGKICDRVAVGMRKWGDPTPVTTNDVFHIGSDTKSMTATLTAMLIEEGKLRWGTMITEVFPELKGRMDKQYEAVTVEQLLTHRGGVPGKPPAAAWKQAWEQEGTPREQRYEFIQAVLAEPPEAAPGTKMIYSNQGYAIVGAMLERITDTPWETLITERLFKPLHMNSAGFGPPGTIGEVDQPWGHIRKSGTIVPLQKDNPPAIAPAGSVHCSLDDLAHYTISQMEGERTGGLLKPETFRKLHTLPEGSEYACGWIVLKRGWAGGNALKHSGSNTMWYVVLWLAPEKDFSIVVATNIADSDTAQACDEAATVMIKTWLGK